MTRAVRAKHMKVIKYISVLVFGAVVGFFLHCGWYLYQARCESRHILNTYVTPKLLAHIDQYYDPSIQIPMPESLDLSSNAWQQLTLWQSFARHFSDYRQAPADYLREILASVTFPATNIICGGRISDEWRMEGNRESEGDLLARKAALMLAEGRSFTEVRGWVSSNYCKGDAAEQRWREFRANPRFGW